jgi:dihydrofolate reductase
LNGYTTWESLPVKPLPDRNNIVVTSKDVSIPGCVVVNDPASIVKRHERGDEFVVIGGGTMYEYFMGHASKMYLTIVDNTFNADVLFPDIDYSKWYVSRTEFVAKEREDGFDLSFTDFTRICE